MEAISLHPRSQDNKARYSTCASTLCVHASDQPGQVQAALKIKKVCGESAQQLLRANKAASDVGTGSRE
jgi:hypothetical protein